ncbi:MAG: cytochrome c [Verrucomicrobiota bacterium]|jgi:cytochrome c553
MKKFILLTIVLGFATALTASAADAKANWTTLCAKCHGQDGKGQTNIGKRLGCKDYSDAKVQAALTDDAIAKAIKEGVTKDGKTLMKATEGLSDADVTALTAYMRSLKQ